MASGPPLPSQGPTIVVPGQGWIDVMSRVVVQVGFPVVVAGVLLWYLLGSFQHNMMAMMDRMSSNADMAGKLITAATTEYQEVQAQSVELRKQSGELTEQTKLIGQIAKDSEVLVKMRAEELALFKDIHTLLVQRRKPAD